MGINVDVLLTEVQFMYRLMRKFSYLDPSFGDEEQFDKDNREAAKYRNLGNAAYRERLDRQALEWYTESVALAAKNSEELALAYANRSAALFRLGEYAPCLLDINRALEGQYPKRLRSKLRDRKKVCLIEIVRLGRVEMTGDETDPIDSTATASNLLDGVNFDNPLLPNTSSKIELACDAKWGRHMIAAKDIEPGEILSCEKFFAAFLVPYQPRTHCSYCFARCAALVSCPACSMVMYCSDRCLTRAFDSYHRTECKVWPFCGNKMPIGPSIYEALRMFYVGTEQGTKLKQFTEELGYRNVFKEKVDPVNAPYAGDYVSVLQVRQTFDQPPVESVAFTVNAIIVLQRFAFFTNRPDPDSMSEEEIFATFLLLNHLQSLRSNNFGITELVKRAVPNSLLVDNVSTTTIGFGMTTLHNLINHSCDPNTVYFTTPEREHVFFSVRPIKRGEQIFTTYIPPFSRNRLAERKQQLAVYRFTCCCEACSNDWPLNTFLMNQNPEFFTDDEKLIVEIATKFSRMIHDCTIGPDNVNIHTLVHFRKLIHNNVRPPSLFISLTEDLIVNYMIRTYSNLYFVNDVAQKENYDVSDEELIFDSCLASNFQRLLRWNSSRIS